MPYIKRSMRSSFDEAFALGKKAAGAPGYLNYVITMVLRGYLSEIGKSYTTMNEVMGVLSAVTQEFYRRIVVPYEETKRLDNGDVY